MSGLSKRHHQIKRKHCFIECNDVQGVRRPQRMNESQRTNAVVTKKYLPKLAEWGSSWISTFYFDKTVKSQEVGEKNSRSYVLLLTPLHNILHGYTIIPKPRNGIATLHLAYWDIISLAWLILYVCIVLYYFYLMETCAIVTIIKKWTVLSKDPSSRHSDAYHLPPASRLLNILKMV